MNNTIIIRTAFPDEFHLAGELMVKVYSQLDGFPKPGEQPEYYRMLANVGELTKRPGTEIVVAEFNSKIIGAVVFFSDMQYYGSGGTATAEKNGAGFRLLAVDPDARGLGAGRKLTEECIRRAKELKVDNIVIHTTKAMQVAWSMYEKLGFVRALDLDFMQGELPVFGFRMKIN